MKTGGLNIDVGIDFDGKQAEAQIRSFFDQINRLGRQIARDSKSKYNPISPGAAEDVKRMVKETESLIRVSSDLRRKLAATNQLGLPFWQWDWKKMIPNDAARAKQMRQAFQYITGSQFGGGGGSGGFGGSAGGWMQGGANILNAGLHGLNGVTGGMSGVVGNSIDKGVSGGWGAGFKGLLGGMAALGVGKLASEAAERVKAAEGNLIAFDKLKRTLGDVNVSFAALKTAISGQVRGVSGFATANGMGIADSISLANQYAKMGNLSNGNANNLTSELGAGVGLSRAYGLDPSQGVGVLGMMRGVGLARTNNDVRKFAVLIGETIGKSKAFAKADEVFDAIGSYATNQARANLGNVNTSGYAGLFAGMVGSGITGLDPENTKAILGRVNAALTAGGAKGEASQFFSARLGAARGLDVFQTQLWREGGMNSTLSDTFNGGIVGKFYDKYYKGKARPQGNETWLAATIGQMERDYGKNPLMMAQATANHTGLSMRQAMTLHTLGSEKTGSLEEALSRNHINLADVNMAGINSLSKVVNGTGADRMGIATELYSRTGKDKLSNKEREALDKVMRNGTEQEQKDMLTSLVAVRDQEETQGKDIRDTKAATENIAELMAEKLIPISQGIRDGVTYLAGNGKMSNQAVHNAVEKAGITEKYQHMIDRQQEVVDNSKGSQGYFRQKEKLDALVAERDKALANVDKSSEAASESSSGSSAGTPRGWRAGQPTASSLSEIKDANQRKNLKAFLDVLRKSEGANYDTLVGGGKIPDFSQHPNKVGLVTGDGPSTAAGGYQFIHKTWKGLAKKLGLKDFSPESQDKAAIELIRQQGALGDILGGNFHSGISKLGGTWVSLPTGTSKHQGKHNMAWFDREMKRALANGTPMPPDAAAAAKSSAHNSVVFKGGFDDANVYVNMPNGERTKAALSPHFTFANPLGVGNAPAFAMGNN